MRITRKMRGLFARKARKPALASAVSTRARVVTGVVLVVLVSLVAILDFSLTAHGLYGYGIRVAKLGRLSVSIPAACDALALVGVAAAFALAHAPLHVRAYAWSVFGVGASASVAGQLSYAQVERLTWQGYVGAAFWPISLALAAHLAIVVWRWTVILPRSAAPAETQREPKAESARVAHVATWSTPDGRALLPIVGATPKHVPKQPKATPPPDMPNEDAPKPGGGPTLTIAGKVPADPKADAIRRAAAGEKAPDIWRSWGSPDTPKLRTVQWWISKNGGKRVAS